MGMDTDLTVEQRDVLKQVRESLSDLMPDCDDEYLLRFIVARKYNAPSSARMLRKHLTYWKRQEYDKILTNFTLDKKSLYFYTTTLGFDKEGSLIRWLRVGQTDLKGLVLSHTTHEALRIAVYFLTQDIQTQKERREIHGDGKDCKMTYILDLQGLPWGCLVSRPIITHFLNLLRGYESNFPEYLKVAYIVNAPSFFGLILNFAKNVLPSDIFTKVVIMNTGESILNRKLRKSMKLAALAFSARKRFTHPKVGNLKDVIDESILPAYLGGELVGPENDPECPHLFAIPPGTPVPEEYYLASNMVGLDGDPEAKKTVVLNQSTFSVELEIKELTTILWDFETQSNDIGMGLRFKKEDKEEFQILIPVRRVNSHRFTESGRYDCKTPGIYEIFFDNSYSWWAKKELTYKISAECKDATANPLS